MKSLLLLAFTILCFTANATTYYFSASGNDANNGTSTSTPWKTLSKFNSVFASKLPGDNFLFNRGDVFYGSIIISRSGSSGLPITIGAYGTGANPVITGLTTVSSWTSLGGNIWESTSAVSTLSAANMVVINGVNTPMGRYPNSGYLPYQSYSGTTSITSSSLSGTPNWTGAEAVIRKQRFVIDRTPVTAQSGGTLTYITSSAYTGQNNYGFFIQKDSRTLDLQNEWYYNPSTKKIRVYSPASPTNVQVATKDTLVTIITKNNITFDGVSFQGSNQDAITVRSSASITIQNCNIDYSGNDAIWGAQNGGAPSSNFVFKNSTINHTNNNAINLQSEFSGALISHNTIKNTGIYSGMGEDGSGNYGSLIGIQVRANNAIIEYNEIDSTGYLGITFGNNNTLVRNNFLNGFCLVKLDGAGIYTYVGAGVTPPTGQKIINNIVLNGIGDNAGTSATGNPIAHGIYLDDGNANVEVSGNTVANCSHTGLYIHNSYNLNVYNNTGFNNGEQQTLFASFNTSSLIRNVAFKNNIFVPKVSTQKAGSFQSVGNDISSFGTLDSNYWARPIDDNLTINYSINSYASGGNLTLAQWQAYSAEDAHSKKSPKAITTVNDLRLEYNPTSANKTISLDGNYIDVKNVSYNGSITLAPYTSAVLIRNGVATNQSPTANAGANQAITLPTSTVSLAGSGTDPDGTISAYSWTKISGPAAGAITSATSAATTVTALVQGIYQFQLKVTDNAAATDLDTVQITVNAAANIAPTVNAGTDQSITLPTSTVSLAGSGTDPDGTISAYSWTKISGPAGGTITSATSAATTVTALVQGIYQFQLKVTDNAAATDLDTVQIIVNAAANIAPTVNAGTDQSITLPTSTVSLSGSGSDADGTISSYSWTKVSGPIAGTITSAGSAATTVTGLAQGVYQFQCKVTDNAAATDLDTVQITVNAAANIAPTANAGTDQSITLPTSTVSLSGSGSDADGTISSYSWTKVSGPIAGTITSTGSAATTVTGLAQGVYKFQCKVTDNGGATDLDTMQVTVNAANIAPTVNAGADQSITLPTSTVSLSGSGSDADGTISSYNWTKVSGPSAGTITSTFSAATTVTGLAQGVYQFQCKVTDNSGAIDLDTMQVTVNAANILPTANAGTDQSITLPTSTVSLSGSGSDADGTISSYSWTKVSGPIAGTITSAGSAATTVTGLAQGVYQFQLKVTDNSGAIALDIIQVTVNAANIAPTVNAGTDQSITLPTSTVSLSGSGSDADGTISSYSWTKVSGPSAGTITSTSSAATTVTGLAQGVYQFQLKVTDNSGATALDIIQVTVNAANIAPTVNAGADQSITLPTSTVSLSGSGSDVDGTISSYSWTKVSGPIAGTITSAGSAATTITGLAQGVYQFQCKVTDNSGATDLDTMQVTVNAANIAPTVNAGADQSITLPTSTVSLSGSGSDADGTISSYSWTKVSGPLAGTITSTSSAATTVTGLAQGVYQFQLKVTDNSGAIALDIIQVTVNAANIAPTVNAGTDQSITLPTSTVSLSGSGSDADGTISSYSWTKVSGPSAGTITSTSSAATTVTGLAQGVYQFQLKVTDNSGATALDIIQVTVNAANIAPTANAGADQSITLPTSTVSLSGSGSDVDGTISSYSWTKVSGPIAGTIASTSSAATTITGLAQGVYQFQLKVTDNSGAIALDIIQVTVNAANIAPTANAGSDQSITLPTSTVTLSGSGADLDGTISSYSWTKVSGPSAYGIVNASSPVTDVYGLAQGVYQFQLKVTDNSGATDLDTMQLTVIAANILPIANAGPDQSITLPTSTANLSGSGSDVDGTISSNSWTKVSGPASGTITSAGSAATTVTGLTQGVYKFQLKVTDNNGAPAADTMQIIVNAAANMTPLVDAGTDQSITLPTNSVSLNGSGTDADGTISYTWTKVSGPSAGTITSTSSAATTVTGMEQGVYQFQLKVTDNNGATALDIIQVTVNAANIPPTVNAGADQSITLPANSVSLNGSGTDADGTISSYSWTKISGPSAGTITSPGSYATTVTGMTQGAYQFQCKVTDNSGAIALDTVQVTVNAANIAPTVNAGPDQSITLPTSTVSLSGSGSDADGTISSYSWTKVSGPAAGTVTSAGSAVTTVTGMAQGVYQFQLKVTDNSGATALDVIQVTVNAANIAPTVNAGADQSITLPTNSVSLNGSGTDADGTISSYSWTKVSGPAAGTVTSAGSAVTTVTGMAQGVYQFQLKVTDNSGATALDVIQVTVNPANIAPTVNAGADQSITLPTNSVSLNGSGTDADGTISSYSWTKVSGPAAGTLTSAGSAVTTVTGMAQGVYQFQLKVTDNSGATALDIIQVTINAANIPPTVDAGADQSITLPTNSVSLNGSGTDADGTISSYSWTKVSGPSAGAITNTSSAATTVTGMAQGVYQFQLKGTDNSGATVTDTVQITVNGAANILPTVDAGTDQSITLPVSTVSLSGSGSDVDGTISSYSWTRVSGPSAHSIVNASSPVTDVSGLTQGVYQFELKVTDNNGATIADTVQITVNAAANILPTVNAGGDQSITLPVSTVSLSGSGSDVDGTISSYSWTRVSGPSAYSIVNTSSPVTDAYGLTEGVYQFELKVTDNNGATVADTVQITVDATANIPPIADAGADQLITLPVSTVSLSGSGSDVERTTLSYSWTKVSGPSAYGIVNASSPVTDVIGLTQGVYQFELKVTDNSGATVADTVQITVNVAGNIPPIANAGAGQTITLPVNITSLAGSGTDQDGVVVNYNWRKLSGPSSYNIVNPLSPVTDVSGLLQGVYMFELKVTDNNGAIGLDTVQIIVNPANIPPTANAGADQSITLPGMLLLSGNGTDPDGTIKRYKWAKISGPSARIVSPNSQYTSVTRLLQGTYIFQLTVTDNKGAIGKDSIKVTVTQGTILFNTPNARIQANKNVVYQNYPNPFTDITTIPYYVAQKASVKIIVSDGTGIQVAVLVNEIKEPGSYQIQWNAGNIPSGNYLYTAIIGNNVSTRWMLKVK